MEKPVLSGMLPEEIVSSLSLAPSFRGKQIFSWISKGATSFEEMTNLSKALRDTLKETADIYSTHVSQVLRDEDGTVKLQITLSDGRAIETVLLTDRDGRKTACVSCQAGCAMGCTFCRTGTLGLARNLSAGEIVEEFLHLEKEAGALSNIVFMGMGEPLQNLSEVQKAVAILTHKDGRNLSARRITISTCGIVKGIYELSESPTPLRLAVSLTTAESELRERLMPVAKGNPLPELKKAIAHYIEKTGRRVTLEAALLAGKNTGEKSAQALIDFASGLDVYINLIPWNPVEGLPFKTPTAQETHSFVHRLEFAGLNVQLRTRRGTNISGACGQLGKTSV